MSTTPAVEQKLSQLRLGRMREVYRDWVQYAEEHQLGYQEFLEELLTEEVLGRQERQLRKRLKAAGFPYEATLEQFDFSQRPELKRAVLMRYFDSTFVSTAGSLLLIGASGLGKTHLAIAIGMKMVQLGYGVRFVTAQQVANGVLLAETRAAREAVLRPLRQCDLLILDEFGYLPLDPQLGAVWYDLLAGRYERGATIITSNKSLQQWGAVVGGETALMMAIIDRLLHHGEVYYLRGASYRLRGKEPVSLAVPEVPAEPASVDQEAPRGAGSETAAAPA
jgi:DNA replication protein DnaC